MVRAIMEIQLRLQGNSERFVIQTKLTDDEQWQNRFWIDQKDDYYDLYIDSDELRILKKGKTISKSKNLVSLSDSKQISFFKVRDNNHLWSFPSSHNELEYYGSSYTLRYVGSGTKGDIIPVTKNGKPVAVFAASNATIAGKRYVSLYTNEESEVEPLLMLYIISYIAGLKHLDSDSLAVRYSLFYAFLGRSALTQEHINMLPKSRRPSTIEAFLWWLLAIIIIVVIGMISRKYLLLFLGIGILYYLVTVIRNLRSNNE